MLSDDRIRALMLAHGFTVKDGLTDLKPYVYAASRAIESAACAERDARIAELEKDVAHKDAYAEQLGRELANATRELAEARKDAEMLDWLDNNMFAREPDEWDQRYGACQDGKTQMWAIFAPKGVHGSARRIIDAAIKVQT